ncbi:hypothetical protein KDM41_08695 [bacterium]|nr:hypothetical protein [bacterium]
MTPSAPHPTEDALFLVAQDLADAAETRAVLDHVRFCRPCADRLEEFVLTAERARADLPASFAAAVPAAAPVARRRLRPRLVAGIVGLAAVLAVAIILPLSSPPPAGPGVYWMSTEFELSAMRSRPSVPPAGLIDALGLYESHDAPAAVAALSELELARGWADLRDVYLYAALVAEQRFAEAEAVYDRLAPDTLPYEQRLAVRWYRYTHLLASGETDAADRLLRRLRTAPGRIGELAREEAARRRIVS